MIYNGFFIFIRLTSIPQNVLIVMNEWNDQITLKEEWEYRAEIMRIS